MLICGLKRASNNYRLLCVQSHAGRFQCVALMSLQGSPWREISAGRHWSCRQCGSARPPSSAASPGPMTWSWNWKEFVCLRISDSRKMQQANFCWNLFDPLGLSGKLSRMLDIGMIDLFSTFGFWCCSKIIPILNEWISAANVNQLYNCKSAQWKFK